MAGICEECGCVCARCTKAEPKHSDMHLHAEIENLRQRLMERDSHIVTMETQFLNEADKFPNGELASMKEELRIWQEKYSRLCEAHKRVQKVNQNLEDKLLRIVDKCETEKGAFAKDIATLSHRLADANYTIHRLTQDNEKYRNDVNLAIQLLQCKPSNFVGQKYDSLPSEVQAKVRTYVAQKRRSSDASPPDVKSITVPISTFPPTAMVYNITKASVEKHSDDESDDSKPPVDVVSAAIMAKVLEDRERERIFAKHCDTCTCHRTIVTVDTETQTTLDRFDVRVCDDCGSTELRNDINAYDSLNGTTSTSRSSGDPLSASNFCRGIENPQGSRAENSHLENSNANVKLYGSLNSPTIPKHNQYATKQKSSQSPSERSALAKTNINKIKQSRLSKRIDATPARTPGSLDHWSKYESDAAPENRAEPKTTTATIQKEPSPVDIINDRIWKSEWSNAKSQLNSTNERIDNRQRGAGDSRIDVINDRVWRNDTSGSSFNINKSQTQTQTTQMTLIEVTNAVNATSPKGGRRPAESAASPSFSSDSVVISTSNQSSSSSDALHTSNENAKRQRNNNNGTKSTGWKEGRLGGGGGPRNCFMRVTPGSKNILLDNVGHYQTVLYTSGTNRPNTALVHVAKSTRSGRSMSTSSEENSPVATTNDSTQLQRVAEWVQSSVGVAKNSAGAKNSREKSARLPLVAAGEKNAAEETLVKIDIDEGAESTSALLADTSNLREVVVQQIPAKNLEDPFSEDTRNVGLEATAKPASDGLTEDLISFENCGDAARKGEILQGDNAEKADENYEVKITKEMEEIYLKLAASLDPVSLRLASPGGSADLTIEKYRKDHRSRIHVQKLQEKPKQ